MIRSNFGPIGGDGLPAIEDAIKVGIDRATKTLRNVKSAWVKEQQVHVSGDAIAQYQVNLQVTFDLDD